MPTEIRQAKGRPVAPTPRPIIPRWVIVAAGGLMLFTIVVAGVSHRAGLYHVSTPPTTALATRDLLFFDQHGGGVLVTDAKTGKRVAMIEPTTGGFMRGIMRGLVREHRLNDQAAGTAFRLTHWADGRLTIADPTTGESFDLEAFGSTNELAFARLLDDAPQAATPAIDKTADQAAADRAPAHATAVTPNDAGATTR